MTTRIAIATALASLSKLNLAIFEARAAGFNVEAYIEGASVPAPNLVGTASPVTVVDGSQTEGLGGRLTGIPAALAADFGKSEEVKAEPVTQQVAASTVQQEVKAEAEFDADARIASLTGTAIYVNRSKKSSSGFVVAAADKSGEADQKLFIGQPSEVIPVGFVNVYKESIGKTVHKNLDKAEEYASGKEIATLPVYKTEADALKGVNAANTEAETAAVTTNEVDAAATRLAALAGTGIHLTRNRRSSSGYNVAKAGDSNDVYANLVQLGETRDRRALGFVNVYKTTLGTTVHATKAKAEQYANGKEIGMLALFR